MNWNLFLKSNSSDTPLYQLKVDVDFYRLLNGPAPQNTFESGISQLLHTYGSLTYPTQRDLDLALQTRSGSLDPALSVLCELSRTNVAWTVGRLAAALYELGNIRALSYLVESIPVKICSRSNANINLTHGESIELFVEASSLPLPSFFWMHRSWNSYQSLPVTSTEVNLGHQTIRSSVFIEDFCQGEEGIYCCMVHNSSLENKKNLKEVSININAITNYSNASVATAVPAQTIRGTQQLLFDTTIELDDKFALLIGQMDYETMPLKAPETDIAIMSRRLEQLGFQVIQLFNLDQQSFRQTIHRYTSLLNPRVYSFFYYAGHGYHNNGKDYCHALDFQSGFCAQEIIKLFQDKKPAANMLIFDMCRTEGQHSGPSSMDTNLKDTENMAVLFTCSIGSVAFEIKTNPELNEDERLSYSPLQKAFVERLGSESINSFFVDVAHGIRKHMKDVTNDATMAPNLNIGIYDGSLSDPVSGPRSVFIPSIHEIIGPQIHRLDLWQPLIVTECRYNNAHNVLTITVTKTSTELSCKPYFNIFQINRAFPNCNASSVEGFDRSIYSSAITIANLETLPKEKQFIEVEIGLFQDGYDVPDQDCIPLNNRFLIRIDLPFIADFIN